MCSDNEQQENADNVASKNIIVCSDGTGNTANKGRGTNVFKVFESIDTRSPDKDGVNGPKRRQIPIYCDGVGTEKLKIPRILGGALGIGFSRNVKRLYCEIIRIYKPGDHIYLFGFSRGAHTVRVLAGLIDACGIPSPESIREGNRGATKKCDVCKATKMQPDVKGMSIERFAKEAYSAYRGKYRAMLDPMWDLLCIRRWSWRNITRIKDDYNPPKDTTNENITRRKVPIRFIGVWDTVDAVGFPVVGIATLWDRIIFRFSFREKKLSESVATARHALSLDDERRTFHPTLWSQDDPDDHRIQQIWFAGVHSNVGGGYPKQGISHRPLLWIMKEANKNEGLEFSPGTITHYETTVNIHDHLYDSRAGFAVYYRYTPRNIRKLASKCNAPILIDLSVAERIAHGSNAYSPVAWPKQAKIIDAVTGTRYQGAEQIIQEQFGDHQRPLSGAQGPTYIRITAQWLLVTGSLLLLSVAFESDKYAFKSLSLKKILGSIKEVVWQQEPLAIAALTLVLGSYITGLLTSHCITNHSRQLWDKIRNRLQVQLNAQKPKQQTSNKQDTPPVQLSVDSDVPLRPAWSAPIYHTLAAAILLVCVFFGGICAQKQFFPVPNKSSIKSPFTEFTGYSPEQAIKYMQVVNKNAGNLKPLVKQLHIDQFFPCIYGFVTLLVLARALHLFSAISKRRKSYTTITSLAMLLVAIIMAADWFENGIWLEQLTHYPDTLNPNRLNYASLATIIKTWGILTAATLTLILTWIANHRIHTATGNDIYTASSTGGAGNF